MSLIKFIQTKAHSLLAKLGFKRKYTIAGVQIEMSFSHLRPEYEKNHPLYDKFLPHLVKVLPEDTLIVEVGANVGYALIEMARANSSLKFVAIEADHRTFEDLQKNVASLRKIEPNVSVTIVKEFIGLAIDNVSLEPYSGSNHAVIDGGAIKSKPLVETFSELDLDSEKLSLLITDVDGFDWDVIQSAYKLFEQNPYIYFECFYTNLDQLENFNNLFYELQVKGYSDFAFFDNYGQYICTTSDLSQIKDMLDYIAFQNFSNSSRTMYYYDVLAFPKNKSADVKELIYDFNQQFPR